MKQLVILLLAIAVASAAKQSSLKNVKFPFNLPKHSGPWVLPTAGEVWPKPQLQETQETFMILRPTTFQFQVTGKRCDIMDEALRRYYETIFYPARWKGVAKRFRKLEKKLSKIWKSSRKFRGYLDSVEVNLLQSCETLPSLDMDEQYEIKVDTQDMPQRALIVSQSIWGILRGLESFSQLVYTSQDGVAFQINSTLIRDFPRFAHRGILLDSSRHFLPVAVIKENLDVMAHNKLNVFHWHIVDEQAFPYQSVRFPNMSRYGSFNEYSHVYTPSDIREIIEYARLRGIRVVPEFDTPGHTWSWGNGIPGLLTACYTNGTLDGTYGPINPARQENYVFLRQFFKEVFDLFPEPYVHLGGDEVEFDCWASNPEVMAFMESHGWGKNFTLLEQFYMERLMNETQAVTADKMKYLVWQEVVDNNVTLRQDTVIHVWKDEQSYAAELERVTRYGYRTLLSSPWYLNYISYGIDWDKYYRVEPLAFNGSAAQKRLVIGGEACMWGEYVDAVNLTPRLWPRACAVAERLWSNEQVNSARAAAPRLEEHRCRLLRRGYNVEPANGVGYCDVEWK